MNYNEIYFRIPWYVMPYLFFVVISKFQYAQTIINDMKGHVLYLVSSLSLRLRTKLFLVYQKPVWYVEYCSTNTLLKRYGYFEVFAYINWCPQIIVLEILVSGLW